MKIRFKPGRKFDGEEFFTHARLMILINALADNEYKIYKHGKWDEKGKDFLYEYALKDAIKLGFTNKEFKKFKKYLEENYKIKYIQN